MTIGRHTTTMSDSSFSDDHTSRSVLAVPNRSSQSVLHTQEVKAAPTSTNASTATKFDHLGVEPWLVRSLLAMSISRPTPVQAACIPAILEGQHPHNIELIRRCPH